MKSKLLFELNGNKVEITETAVKCKDISLTQELVSLLMTCRATCGFGKDPVLRLFNQYVCFMETSNLSFSSIPEERYIVPSYILEEEMMLEQLAA